MATITLQTEVRGPVDITAQQIMRRLDDDPRPHIYDGATRREIAENIIERAEEFGARASLNAAQIIHETGAFRYGGQVKPEQFNFAGIGATNDGAAGATFPSVDSGVLHYFVHWALYVYGHPDQWPDHLRTYRDLAIRLGPVQSAGYLGVISVMADWTNGRWAWSPQYPRHTLQNGYAQSIVNGANRIRGYARNGQEQPVTAQIPGFAWRPAKSSHFQRGRTQPIRGYAQHYTAGTNSLGWLTGDSRPPVSSTFLIKHNPTLEDRGWQLVRIEDTAWTTAHANPFTVSCEYEHTGSGTIPEVAYTVMAQTIIDTSQYVDKHDLGAIPLTNAGIKGHKEWVNNPSLICPDGIDMARLIAKVQELSKGGGEGDLIVNGKRIIGGMRWRYEALGELVLPTLGLPRTEEFESDVDGVPRRVQVFERGILAWYPENLPHGAPSNDPMHVRSLTLAEAQSVLEQAMKQGLI